MPCSAASPPALEADIPAELPDRAGDAWESLFAIADAAGDGWPARARSAAVVLHANREADDSLGLRLLSDVQIVFGRRRVERISTTDLIEALKADEEGPWLDARVPLTPHRLGRLLGPFGIRSKQLRVDGTSLKGYERDWFVDSWDRYLPVTPSPAEAKHRNTEQERSFDVSDRTPSGSDGDLGDLSIEDDYPQSAWAPDDAEDDPQAAPWIAGSLPVPDRGAS